MPLLSFWGTSENHLKKQLFNTLWTFIDTSSCKICAILFWYDNLFSDFSFALFSSRETWRILTTFLLSLDLTGISSLVVLRKPLHGLTIPNSFRSDHPGEYVVNYSSSNVAYGIFINFGNSNDQWLCRSSCSFFPFAICYLWSFSLHFLHFHGFFMIESFNPSEWIRG